jgi:hypothetical protein
MKETRADLLALLNSAAGAIVNAVESWKRDDWDRQITFHGEQSEARNLALHIARRSHKVASLIEPRLDKRAPDQHLDPSAPPVSDGEITAALRAAWDEAVAITSRLDHVEIARQRAAEIDGERDVLMASCGLIGHWIFHMPAIEEVTAPLTAS